MTQLLLMAFLLLSSGPAYAAWELLDRDDDRGETMRAEECHRSLTFTDFSGNMGNGNEVFSDLTEQNWAHHSVGCPEDALIHGFNSSQLSWRYAGLYSTPTLRAGYALTRG